MRMSSAFQKEDDLNEPGLSKEKSVKENAVCPLENTKTIQEHTHHDCAVT